MQATQRSSSPPRSRRNLYGRARHRRLSPTRRAAFETLAPRLAIPGADPDDNPRRDLLPPDAFGGAGKRVWLEIGFGTGEHLLALSRARPDVAMLGAEPYRAGASRLLATAGEPPPANLRIHVGDGRDLLEVLPGDVVERTYLLYPDPWPKRRHARRRFLSAETLDQLARVSRAGGELRFATDIPLLARHALAEARRHGAFCWTAERAQDWRNPWPGWSGTRYEAKALAAGRSPIYLVFVRSELPFNGSVDGANRKTS